jgi:site-specific DNA-methyltransferase (adenine-specific)
MDNILFEGNSLDIMKTLPEGFANMVYLDPPFFTNRSHESTTYNGSRISFEDIWKNGIDEYLEFMSNIFKQSLRILNTRGTLFLHCDWHAVHYLKVELDKIFGYHNFRNEIIWKRHNSQNNCKQGTKIFSRMHDTILFYSKSADYTWNQPFKEYSEEYKKITYNKVDEENGELYAFGDLTGPGGSSKGNPKYEFLGVTRYWRYNKSKMEKLFKGGKIIQTKPGSVPKLKRYLKNMRGVPLNDIWSDIQNEQTTKRKSLSYPTQKPLVLLDRLIKCATNIGDVVFDPFCGSGTTLIAAHRLERKWIGIDKNHKVIEIVIQRLQKYGVSKSKYKIGVVELEPLVNPVSL